MNNCANENVIHLLGEKHIVRLEAKSTVAWSKSVGAGSDAWKIGKEAECTFKAGIIGVGLIEAKSCFGFRVNIQQIGARTQRYTVFSHGAHWPEHEPRLEYHASCRSWPRRSRGVSVLRADAAIARHAAALPTHGFLPRLELPWASRRRSYRRIYSYNNHSTYRMWYGSQFVGYRRPRASCLVEYMIRAHFLPACAALVGGTPPQQVSRPTRNSPDPKTP